MSGSMLLPPIKPLVKRHDSVKGVLSQERSGFIHHSAFRIINMNWISRSGMTSRVSGDASVQESECQTPAGQAETAGILSEMLTWLQTLARFTLIR